MIPCKTKGVLMEPFKYLEYPKDTLNQVSMHGNLNANSEGQSSLALNKAQELGLVKGPQEGPKLLFWTDSDNFGASWCDILTPEVAQAHDINPTHPGTL